MNDGVEPDAAPGPEPGGDGVAEPACVEAATAESAPAVASDVPMHPGRTLGERRTQAGLSVADVVSRLKISARFIHAIEAGRWDEVGTPAILRGFVRAYARALDLDPTPLVQGLPQQVEPSATLSLMPTLTAPMPPAHGSRPGGSWWLRMALLAIVVVAAAVAIGWLNTHDLTLPHWPGTSAPAVDERAATTSSSATTGDGDLGSVSVPVAPTVLAPADRAMSGSSAQSGSGAPAGATPPEAAAAQSAPVNPMAALYLHATQDSWVEVVAADGRTLLRGIVAADERRSLDADGRLSLVIGNVRGVEVMRRGLPVDLAQYAHGGNVARLTLD